PVIPHPRVPGGVVPSASGSTLSGTSVLDATASGGGGIAKVQFALTGGSLNQAVVGTAVPTLYGYVSQLNTTTVPNGTCTLQSVASDAGGNAGFSSGVQITIANAPPATSVI